MPKRHSSALSYPELLFKAAFLRKNTHTRSCFNYSFLVTLFMWAESIIPLSGDVYTTGGTGATKMKRQMYFLSS